MLGDNMLKILLIIVAIIFIAGFMTRDPLEDQKEKICLKK